jgi:aquaporin Z
MFQTMRSHWPEYLCEALGLGLFMLSACLFGVLLEYPSSPAHLAVPGAFVRRLLMGLAMGATAIAMVYSPWGQRSGAHLNPTVTLAFLRLRRVRPWDALFYAVAQLAGGTAGVFLAASVAPIAIRHPSVNCVVTVPGDAGWVVAAFAELTISFCLMLAVLSVTSRPRFARYAGLVAGTLVAAYIAVEAPYSGMSMNPARSAASSLVAHVWTAWWVYVLIPPLAMLLASEVHRHREGQTRAGCAKLHHSRHVRCIFCGFVPDERSATTANAAAEQA